MAQNRPDRRVGRTRRRLKEALLELLGERPYEQITVRELAERADVGRSTFYSHYATKEDLLFSGFDEWLLSLVAGEGERGASDAGAESRASGTEGPPRGDRRDSGPAGFAFSRPLLEHFQSQRRFFRAAILGGREARVRRRTTELLARTIRVELARNPGAGTTPGEGAPDGPDRGRAGTERDEELALDAAAHAAAGALLGLASWWLEHPRRLEPEFVDRVFQEVVRRPSAPGIASDEPTR